MLIPELRRHQPPAEATLTPHEPCLPASVMSAASEKQLV